MLEATDVEGIRICVFQLNLPLKRLQSSAASRTTWWMAKLHDGSLTDAPSAILFSGIVLFSV